MTPYFPNGLPQAREVFAKLDCLETIVARPLEEWACVTALGEREEGGPKFRRQRLCQTKHLPFGSTDKWRGEEVDDVHRGCLFPRQDSAATEAHTRSSRSASAVQS
jgi:hypothetical protein